MKNTLISAGLRAGLIALLFWCAPWAPQAAEYASESDWIAAIQSDAPLAERDAACVMLKRLGTVRSVPALAALLTDPDLSISARYALESMPFPEAGQALLAALDQTDERIQAGIIQSLGARREAGAVPALTALLADVDPNTAGAAAGALGEIGTPEAAQALMAGLDGLRDDHAHTAAITALLAAADRLVTAGKRTQAVAIYERLGDPMLPAPVRMAAYTGCINADPTRALALTVDGIVGTDEPVRMAALRAAHALQGPAVTGSLGKLLPALSPATQLSLIVALRQRGDPAALPALIGLLQKDDAPAASRLEAIRALGELGGGGAVRPLAESAAARNPAESKAALDALHELRGDGVNEALLAELTAGASAGRKKVAMVLSGRGDASVVPALIKMTGNPDAFQVVGGLGGPAEVAPLVAMVREADDDQTRSMAGAALTSIGSRLQARGEPCDPAPILEGLTGGTAPVRLALMPVASYLADARVRDVLIQGTKDADPAMRAAAEEALFQTADPALMPHLLTMARQAPTPVGRVKALRGALRLATDPQQTALSSEQRIAVLKEALPLAENREEKSRALSGLARIPSPASLELSLTMLNDPTVGSEAAVAATQIASALAASDPPLARKALRAVLAGTDDVDRLAAAREALAQLDAMAGFLLQWEVSGPYRKEGLNSTALFDTAFSPETADAAGVEWQPLAAGTDPTRPYVLDLLKAIEGNSQVAYVRTVVVAPSAQPARLEIGVDDGLKAWFNGEQVAANNYIGGLQVGANKADIQLKQGANTLLLKVTQNNMMWEYCVRLIGQDGVAIEGLRYGDGLGGGEVLAALPEPEPTPVPTPAAPSPVPFTRHQLDSAFRSEGVAVADFNNDGIKDLATGTMLYLAPDWKGQPMQGEVKTYPLEGYSQEFYCFAQDLDQDGWQDLIVIGFPGAQTRWMHNPGKAGGVWPAHVVIEKTGSESPDWLDVDGDGRREMVFFSEQGLALAQPGADPAQPWPLRVLAAPGDPRPGHGLGVGDINGDGRNDVVCPEGWWESPADAAAVPWPFHAAKLSDAPAQMVVMDADGDGDADVISSAAHQYGMWWAEQTPEGWKRHEIDNSISQLHALHLADIDGDGLMDLVTGKRFYAHSTGDAGINDPAVLAWYGLKRVDGRPVWTRYDIDADSGVGLHVQIVDANGDGLLDIASSCKKGVYLFTQEKRASAQ